MIDISKIRQLVEPAVAETFDEHLRALHDDIVSRVLLSITPMIEAGNAAKVITSSAGASAGELNEAISAIQRVSQQVDILKGLLEGSAAFSARTALFILRGNVAVGWQARGFADDDSIKAVMIDSGSGVLGKVVHGYSAYRGTISEFDSKFSASMGSPADDDCVLVPLVVRGKVAAVVYADAGDEGAPVDVPAVELLSRAAGDWIELQALRKAAGAPAHYPLPAQGTQTQIPATAPTVPVRQEDPPKAPVPAPSVAVPTVPAGLQASAAAPPPAAAGPGPYEKPASPVSTSIAPPDPETPQASAVEPSVNADGLHMKARRFAKLLVDEIILYNQRKVTEGRQQHDLYDRLKDDIEKSRATYDKRYAQTAVASHDYFTQAVIAGLADHNPALLGSSFPR